jgi:hypothetical protein
MPKNFEHLPVIFLPVNFYEEEAITVDVAGEYYKARINKSFAGMPREAYEKLMGVAETFERMPRSYACVGYFFKNIAHIIEEEFLKSNSPVKYWQEVDPQLQTLMIVWKSSVKRERYIQSVCQELAHKIDTISLQSNLRLTV